MTCTAVAFAALAVLAARTSGNGCLARADQAAFGLISASRIRTGIAIARAVSLIAEPGLALRRGMAVPNGPWEGVRAAPA
jgi:hypothetical protein